MARFPHPDHSLYLIAVLSAGLAGCIASDGKAPNCAATESNFRYVGTDNLILEIDEFSTDAIFYLGSKDDDVSLARDLAKDGIVHWGWLAITDELIDGGEFNEANISCQGFQISNDSTLVRCEAVGQDRPRAYLFERGRGIVKFWWNGNRASLVTLSGNCGYGYSIG